MGCKRNKKGQHQSKRPFKRWRRLDPQETLAPSTSTTSNNTFLPQQLLAPTTSSTTTTSEEDTSFPDDDEASSQQICATPSSSCSSLFYQPESSESESESDEDSSQPGSDKDEDQSEDDPEDSRNMIISKKIFLLLLKEYAEHAPIHRRSQICHSPGVVQRAESMKFTSTVICSCGWSSDRQQQSLRKECVTGSVAAGIGARPLNKLMACMDMPTYRPSTFSDEERKFGEEVREKWEKEAVAAHNEEIELAIKDGRVYRGLPWLQVVVDAGWQKVSHGHSYNSSSGVAVIIGAATKKVLQVIPKNSKCHTCKVSPAKEHECAMNHKGSSGSMESKGIVEGFERATDYGCYYLEYVGDGDSSVADSIICNVSYGTDVRKVPCANHSVKNVRKHLEELRKDKDNKSLTAEHAAKITYSTRMIVNVSKSSSECQDGIRNTMFHVGGSHARCREDWGCDHPKEESDLVWPTNVCEKIRNVLNRLAETPRLYLNLTTNSAEAFMNVRRTMDGNKHVDRGKSQSWSTRCHAAALRFNHGETWPELLITLSPVSRRLLNTLENKNIYNNEYYKKKEARRVRGQKRVPMRKDDTYGQVAVQDVEIVTEDLVRKMEEFHGTIPQASTSTQGTPEWLQERRLRLTASNFGEICKMRQTTKPKCIVEKLLYASFKGNAATAYGLAEESESERRLVDWLETQGVSEVSVAHPGLIVLKDHKVLGGSPDGIVVCDPGSTNVPSRFVVEYKNPKSLVDRGMTVDDAITGIKGFALRTGSSGYELKCTHSYYYQVQGVMAATGITDTAFVIRGAANSMAVVWVKYDQAFVTECTGKLLKFYFQAILPELAHPVVPKAGSARSYFVEWDFSSLC